jgi:hypothetical protein
MAAAARLLHVTIQLDPVFVALALQAIKETALLVHGEGLAILITVGATLQHNVPRVWVWCNVYVHLEWKAMASDFMGVIYQLAETLLGDVKVILVVFMVSVTHFQLATLVYVTKGIVEFIAMGPLITVQVNLAKTEALADLMTARQDSGVSVLLNILVICVK